MWTLFKDVKPGDRLTADHVNALNKAARVVEAISPGSFQNTAMGTNVPLEPFSMHRVIIVEEDYDVGLANNLNDCYEIRLLYYDFDDRRWYADDQSGPYFLDGSDFGAQEVGNKLVAYWDQQREMFVPTSSPATAMQIIMFTIVDLIPKEDDFWNEIYKD